MAFRVQAEALAFAMQSSTVQAILTRSAIAVISSLEETSSRPCWHLRCKPMLLSRAKLQRANPLQTINILCNRQPATPPALLLLGGRMLCWLFRGHVGGMLGQQGQLTLLLLP